MDSSSFSVLNDLQIPKLLYRNLCFFNSGFREIQPKVMHTLILIHHLAFKQL